MTRSYKCLSQQIFASGDYKLVPIRDEDRHQIRQWRNEQIDILRQKEPLTIEKQDEYFKEVVAKLFENESPAQLLFSFLENDSLVGYGGLVHIDWKSRNGEVSFITETGRNRQVQQFKNDWGQFLRILKVIATVHLRFNKIYTYAYDVRPALFCALGQNNFTQEAVLKNHVCIQGNLHHVLIHSYFCTPIVLKDASEKDILPYFNWVNDKRVRENSFDEKPISIEEHRNWFLSRIKDPNSIMMVAYFDEEAIGQVRFDQTDSGVYQIDFSVAKKWRGLGIGGETMKIAVADFVKKQPHFRKIIARVKKHNDPSRKVFLKCGFELSTVQNDISDVYHIENRS